MILYIDAEKGLPKIDLAIENRFDKIEYTFMIKKLGKVGKEGPFST